MTGQVFTVERRVRFADCDAAGIVFFPRYFEMLNGVVEDWFAGPLGASFRELHINRQVSVRCSDGFVLANQAAQLFSNHHHAGLQCRVSRCVGGDFGLERDAQAKR